MPIITFRQEDIELAEILEDVKHRRITWNDAATAIRDLRGWSWKHVEDVLSRQVLIATKK